MTTIIEQNIKKVQQQIADTAIDCDYDPKKITLLAVSKTKSVTDIQAAINAGLYQFGENYIQEGIQKISYFSTKNYPITWHFIGHLQSNKTRLVAENFDWVQTIDRIKIASRLNQHRPPHCPPLNVLIQINIDQEKTKSGILVNDAEDLAKQISLLPNLCLRGIMAIPAPDNENHNLIASLTKMQQLFLQLKSRYPTIDTLSMGMTDDMVIAIKAGSTMVRIGSAIFGERKN